MKRTFQTQDERVTKGKVVRFRIDLMRKKHWAEAMKELGVRDFSSYARQAIDAAFQRDFRSKDPQWQTFLKEVRPISEKILGYRLVDRPEDRLENQEVIERILFKRGQELAKERMEPLTASLTSGKRKRPKGIKILGSFVKVKALPTNLVHRARHGAHR